MRIGINGRFLMAKRTGVQRAAYNLVRSLVRIDRQNEYIIFTGHQEKESPDWDYPNVKVHVSKLRGGESFYNHLWEQAVLPSLAKRYQVDILHSPANVAPLFYSGKSIVHIHDLCFVVNPQWYSFSFRTLYNIVIPILSRKATKVVTNSNNSRNDLLQHFGLSAEKVSLVYWAVDEKFLEPSSPGPCPVEKDFILYVGSLEPRKNIRSLIEAYEMLRSTNSNLKPKLVLIGGESPLFADVQLNLQERYRNDVLFKGFVNDAELKQYYRHASLVAYPSLYEGFGLPPLEAMASGTAVVTSNTSSLPEVVGEAALTVDPTNVKELCNAMEKVLENSQYRESLIQMGKAQVGRFNWDRVARSVLSIYYEVVQSKSTHSVTSNALLSMEEWRRIETLYT